MQTTLLFANYITVVAAYKHQMELRWSHLDTISLIILHLLFTILLALGFFPIKNKFVLSFLPLAYLLFYVGYFLRQPFGVILAIILIVAFLGYRSDKLQTWIPAQKLYVAILMCSISFAFFSYMTIISAHHNFVSKYSNANNEDQTLIVSDLPKNVFFIIFDMFSYQQLYLGAQMQGKEKLQVHARYKNISNFAGEAYNFHLALSPFKYTLDSIPAIIQLDTRTSESGLFELFKSLQYDTALLGFHFNYCDYVKNLNYCETFHKHHLKSKVNPFIVSSLRHLSFIFLCGDRFYKKLILPYYKLLFAHRTVKVTQEMEDAYFDFIRNMDASRHNFVYFHYPLPHSAYAFTKDGPRSLTELKSLADIEVNELQDYDSYTLYKDNLDYVDKKFGEIVQVLKSRGIYDESMIIITGDHSMRHIQELTYIKLDPYLYEYWLSRNKSIEKMLISETHVPLLIKMPYQKEKVNVTQALSNTRLFSKDGQSSSLFDQKLQLDWDSLNSGKLMRDPVETKKFDKLI